MRGAHIYGAIRARRCLLRGRRAPRRYVASVVLYLRDNARDRHPENLPLVFGVSLVSDFFMLSTLVFGGVYSVGSSASRADAATEHARLELVEPARGFARRRRHTAAARASRPGEHGARRPATPRRLRTRGTRSAGWPPGAAGFSRRRRGARGGRTRRVRRRLPPRNQTEKRHASPASSTLGFTATARRATRRLGAR